MKNMKKRLVGVLAVLPLFLGAWTVFHIELTDSFPKDGQALAEAPAEIWLEFSVVPDTATSTFTVRGPAGSVVLDSIHWNPESDDKVLKATVEGETPAGDYIISWVAAPVGDHGGRGRIPFTISGGR